MDVWLIHSAVDLGKLVRAARKEARVPINKAAMLCGVSVQFMHDLEHGKPSLQFDKAVSVARQMGLQLEAKKRRLEGLSESNGQ
jgi:DNA-binding XRE family transcriptional regulator